MGRGHGWLCVLAKQGTPSLASPPSSPPPQACGLCSPQSWLSHSPGLLCFQTPQIRGGRTGRRGRGRVCPCPRSALSMVGGGPHFLLGDMGRHPLTGLLGGIFGIRMGRGCSRCPAHSRCTGRTGSRHVGSHLPKSRAEGCVRSPEPPLPPDPFAARLQEPPDCKCSGDEGVPTGHKTYAQPPGPFWEAAALAAGAEEGDPGPAEEGVGTGEAGSSGCPTRPRRRREHCFWGQRSSVS